MWWRDRISEYAEPSSFQWEGGFQVYGGDAVSPRGYAVGMTGERSEESRWKQEDTKLAPRTQSHLPEGQVEEGSATEDYIVDESRGNGEKKRILHQRSFTLHGSTDT